MKADQLGLRGTALDAARDYETRFPHDVFTSGRRDITDQARAMASNVVRNRQWIAQTYIKPLCVAARTCQNWVDGHPEAKTAPQIAIGLTVALGPQPYAELAKLSCHLSGDAFDVEPDDDHLKDAFLQSLASKYGGKFLNVEGGLKRRHWQAKP